MKETMEQPVKEPIWGFIGFFAFTAGVAFIGGPLYLYYFDVPLAIWILTTFYTAVTGLGITVGYHRLFAHRTFKAHPLVEFIILFFGSAAFEQSALKWSSQHRDHHRFVDTDRDPYNIKKGFFYAHMGWLLFWRFPKHYENSLDLQQNKLVAFQHKYYPFWAAVSGIIVPVMIGAFFGDALAAFIFAVCVRLTFVYQATFCINSVCHMFGKATYDIYSTAKDHWFVALLTYGEGYHNFHHRFPTDYRNAIRWYQWDPSKWLIWTLGRLGLAWDIKRVSNFRIIEAKLAAEKQTASDWIEQKLSAPEHFTLREKLNHNYVALRDRLFAWEQAAKHYHEMVAEKSAELIKAASEKLENAQNLFFETRRQWRAFQIKSLGLA